MKRGHSVFVLLVLVVLVVLGVVVEAAWFGSTCCLLPPAISTCEANDGDIRPCSSWRFCGFICHDTCHDAISFKLFKACQRHDVWLVVPGDACGGPMAWRCDDGRSNVWPARSPNPVVLAQKMKAILVGWLLSRLWDA